MAPERRGDKRFQDTSSVATDTDCKVGRPNKNATSPGGRGDKRRRPDDNASPHSAPELPEKRYRPTDDAPACRWLDNVVPTGKGRRYAEAASARAHLGDYDGALDECARWTDSALQSADAHRWTGLVHYHRPDLPRAIAAFRSALQADPLDHGALRWLGICLHDTGDFEAALAAHATLAPDAELLYLKGAALAQLDRMPEALAALDRAAELVPNDAWVAVWRGHVLERMRSYEPATSAYDAAIRSGDPAALLYAERARAHCLYRLGRHADALAALDDAISHGGALDAECAKWRGQCLHRLGRLADALAEWQRAGSIEPNDAWTKRAATLCARQLGPPVECPVCLETTDTRWLACDHEIGRAHV